MKRVLRQLAWLGMGMWAMTINAAPLTIEITEGLEGAMPIAIAPFGWPATTPPATEDMASIIAGDLRRSGRFSPLAESDMLSRPHTGEQVNFADWRLLGVDSLVVGRVLARQAGQYEVQFQLFDVFRGRQLAGYSIPAPASELRRVAHTISDLVYERLTGMRGAFNTRIAYVTTVRRGGASEYALQFADADGYNAQTILTSPEPIMSPAWSQDGRQLAYVSFERGKAEIFVQQLTTGKRRSVSSLEGLNGAPAWSPDHKQLAITLSRDGNAEIYVLDLATGASRRLTHHLGIDTEPAWSPDGKSIVFTSDRGGRPQLYRVAASGGTPQRLTFEGRYNAGADFSPDGRRLAMVHQLDSGQFRIAVLELDSGLMQVVTEGSLDESPSFAPNGSMILYADGGGRQGELAAVSVDGRFRQRLKLQGGDVREPAWSPYTH